MALTVIFLFRQIEGRDISREHFHVIQLSPRSIMQQCNCPVYVSLQQCVFEMMIVLARLPAVSYYSGTSAQGRG